MTATNRQQQREAREGFNGVLTEALDGPPATRMLRREQVRERRQAKQKLARCTGWSSNNWPTHARD